MDWLIKIGFWLFVIVAMLAIVAMLPNNRAAFPPDEDRMEPPVEKIHTGARATMKITSAHLDAVKNLSMQASGQVASDAKTHIDANEKLQVSRETERAIAASFDILASTFVSDSDLEDARASQLPESVQKAIGFVKKPSPPVVKPPDAPKAG